MNFIQRIPTLTNRELQILELVALGKSAKEVAQDCDIAPRTVARDWRFARAFLQSELGEEI